MKCGLKNTYDCMCNSQIHYITKGLVLSLNQPLSYKIFCRLHLLAQPAFHGTFLQPLFYAFKICMNSSPVMVSFS